MKQVLLCTIAALFLSLTGFAQTPQYLPYQAVARNTAGNLLSNQNVTLRFTVHDVSATGTILYQEKHSATTNKLGLFNVNIGAGTVLSGTFGSIAWGSGTAKYMQVEIDPTGGTTYTDMGASQMMSVPYALYAGSAGSASGTAGGDLTGTYPNPSLANAGTSGTYTKVTTDAKGRVTSGSNLTATDIPTGNLTESTSSVLSITGGNSSVVGTGTSIQVKQASGSQNGYLSSTDYTTFNNKQHTVTLTTTGDNGAATFNSGTGALNIPNYSLTGLGGVGLTDLGATAPLNYDNSTGTFSIPVASTSANGYLSSAAYTTFNNKQTTVSLSTTGNNGAATFNSSTGALNIPDYTLAGLGGISLTGLSASAPLNYNNTTGAFSINSGGIGNSLLANPSLTVTAGTGLSGGGSVSLGGTVTLTNAGVTSLTAGTGVSLSGSTGAITVNVSASGIGAITSLNGLSGTSQTFANGTSGTAPAFASSGTVHTLNIPMASTTSVTAGLLSNTDWNTFNNKVGGSGTTNNLAKFTGTAAIGNSLLADNGTSLYLSNNGGGDSKAILDLTNSGNLAFLPPSMTYAQEQTLAPPTTSTNGYVAYNTTSNCLDLFTNGHWQSIYCGCPTLPALVGITGNISVCAGSTQSYVVPAITGATSYTWTVTGNPTITGQGSNSISFTAPSGTTYTVSVTAANACTGAQASSVSKTLGVSDFSGSPATPTWSGTAPSVNVCTSATATYTVTSLFGSSGTGVVTYSWTVSATGSATATITANSATANSSTPATFTSTSSPSITLNYGSGTGTVTVSVVAINTCNASSALSVGPITVSTQLAGTTPATPSISTGSPVCGGSAATISVTAVSGATSYTWTGVPIGFSVTTGSITSSAFGGTLGNTGGIYNLGVTASNGCSSSSASSTTPVAVYTGAPATPTWNPTPAANVCTSTNGVTYTVTNLIGTSGTGVITYSWTVSATGSATATITANSTTANSTTPATYTSTSSPSITLNYGTGAGTVTVSAVAINTCNSSSALSATITVSTQLVGTTPVTPGMSPVSPICSGTSATISTTAVTGATSYAWTGVPTGFSLTAGSLTSNSFTGTIGSTGGTFNVGVTASNGCSTTSASSTLPVTVYTGVPPTPSWTAAPATSICPSQTITYAITALTGATGAANYTWTFTVTGSASATVNGTTVTASNSPYTISNTATTSYSVAYGSGSGSLAITVAGNNACGSTAAPLSTTITVGVPHGNYTWSTAGAQTTVTLSSCVTNVSFTVIGGSGGVSSAGGTPGLGAIITGTITTTGGGSFTAYVGSQGGAGSSATGGSAGSNGGSAILGAPGEGAAGGSGTASGASGGGGGAASELVGGNQSAIYAGGGGGAGDDPNTGCAGLMSGGNAGTMTLGNANVGANGAGCTGASGRCNSSSNQNTYGQGGTQSAGGYGGDPFSYSTSAECGSNGSYLSGNGGAGGYDKSTNNYGGGGGGGGWAGGGGGSGGGGGGGSSYVNTTAYTSGGITYTFSYSTTSPNGSVSGTGVAGGGQIILQY